MFLFAKFSILHICRHREEMVCAYCTLVGRMYRRRVHIHTHKHALLHITHALAVYKHNWVWVREPVRVCVREKQRESVCARERKRVYVCSVYAPKVHICSTTLLVHILYFMILWKIAKVGIMLQPMDFNSAFSYKAVSTVW